MKLTTSNILAGKTGTGICRTLESKGLEKGTPQLCGKTEKPLSISSLQLGIQTQKVQRELWEPNCCISHRQCTRQPQSSVHETNLRSLMISWTEITRKTFTTWKWSNISYLVRRAERDKDLINRTWGTCGFSKEGRKKFMTTSKKMVKP